MPLRTLIRLLTSRYGGDMVEKLSESGPMRKAARMAAYLYFRSRDLGEQTAEKVKESETADKLKGNINRVQTFKDNFSKELKDGFRDFDKEVKDKMKK